VDQPQNFVRLKEKVMIGKNGNLAVAIVLAGSLAAFSATAFAQTNQNNQGNQNQSGQQQQPNPANKDANKDQKPDTSGSTLDVPNAKATSTTPEEDAAVKSFQAIPNSDVPKKISAGEEFIAKYPESRNLPVVYSALTFAYIQAGKPDKAFEVGDKEVALKPDDVQTLAILSQTIPRAMTSSTPEPEKQLAKAETYGKKAIEMTPALTKPEGMPDQNFNAAKNATLAMAHSGLGIVYFRQKKYTDAIPELEQSVKIDPNPTPDPVNLYILAMSDQKASHYDEAVAAFNKCAAITSGLQNACKNGAEEAKKQSSTSLSAPK
jgi:tetratricopeptide (TPR) repeat protein